MITRKDLLVAIVGTLCVSMVLFSALEVRSTGVYDPWMDVNHDGGINVLDLIKVANVLGTGGNPALSVTVTNFPQTNNNNEVDVWEFAHVSLGSPAVSTTQQSNGFGQLHIVSCATNLTSSDSLYIYVVTPVVCKPDGSFEPVNAYTITLTGTAGDYGVGGVVTIPVPSQWFYFAAYTTSSASNIVISMNYFLTN